MKLQKIFRMKIETTNITNNMQNWHRICCIHGIAFFSQMKLYIILRMKSETTNITIIIYKVTAKCPLMLSINVMLGSWRGGCLYIFNIFSCFLATLSGSPWLAISLSCHSHSYVIVIVWFYTWPYCSDTISEFLPQTYFLTPDFKSTLRFCAPK